MGTDVDDKAAASLTDADDYVAVTLADGSEVEVYGDGMVYFYLADQDVPEITINLYGEES